MPVSSLNIAVKEANISYVFQVQKEFKIFNIFLRESFLKFRCYNN